MTGSGEDGGALGQPRRVGGCRQGSGGPWVRGQSPAPRRRHSQSPRGLDLLITLMARVTRPDSSRLCPCHSHILCPAHICTARSTVGPDPHQGLQGSDRALYRQS